MRKFVLPLIVAALALTGCTASPLPSPTPTVSAAPTPGSSEQPLQVTSALTGQDWQVVVNSVVDDATAQVAAVNPFNPAPPAGQKYILVNLTITRVSATPGRPFDIEVGYAQPGEPLIPEAAVQAPDRIDPLAEVAPRASVTGNVALAVPAHSAGLLMLIVGPGENPTYVALH